MKQEYLFSQEQEKEIKEFIKKSEWKKDVDIVYSQLKERSFLILTIEIKKDNHKAAEILSKANDEILKKFNIQVLTSDSSAYFNKRLFPEINKFERLLRKLLYLVSALGPNEENKLNELESKDLGSIFETLFTDEAFSKEAKTLLNKRNSHFSKGEILKEISGIQENTLFDNLFKNSNISILSKRYIDIKNYRNDIMHAHNINLEKYRKVKNLYNKVNCELEEEIDNIQRNNISNEYSSFNINLKEVFEYKNSLLKMKQESDKMVLNYINNLLIMEDYLKKLKCNEENNEEDNNKDLNS